jgi:peroxiredoxin
MKGNRLYIIASILLVATTGFKPIEVARTVKDFELVNVDGKTISTHSYPRAKGFVVVFTCLHCPFAKLYDERLKQLNAKYSALNIPLLLVNASDTLMFPDENLANMAKIARAKKYSFPYLFDASQKVAKDFNAEKTPHAFVIWKEQNKWVVKYSGAIDDNGAHPEDVKTPYVANALNDLLSGKPVALVTGHSIGCAIHYRK